MEITILCGPPGSGKSTFAGLKTHNIVYINQDLQGKVQHLQLFNKAIEEGKNIIVDRMNFSKEQRNRYLDPAKLKDYKTKIVVLHENYETCLNRCLNRKTHQTIKNEEDARKALDFFFKKYERVENSEADLVERIWPDIYKPEAIICDLDGTLCNIDHRLHYVKAEEKDWKRFFEELVNDTPNKWCLDILHRADEKIVFCSGRPSDYYDLTDNWLKELLVSYCYDLYMRTKGDFRRDDIVKENLLDFEILTRFTPYFIIDDRKQVVDMWRRRGFVTLQCAEGNF